MVMRASLCWVLLSMGLLGKEEVGEKFGGNLFPRRGFGNSPAQQFFDVNALKGIEGLNSVCPCKVSEMSFLGASRSIFQDLEV